jgi:hypothetical protein
MKSNELISIVDQEVSMLINRGINFDPHELVESYHLDDKQAPIVEQYVNDIQRVFSDTEGRIKRDSKVTNSVLDSIGMITSTIVGAGIGALVGYFGNAESVGGCAVAGGMVGIATEYFFEPGKIALGLLYVKSEIDSCEEPRRIYRNKALSQLEEL